jgi:hypothetical protein
MEPPVRPALGGWRASDLGSCTHRFGTHAESWPQLGTCGLGGLRPRRRARGKNPPMIRSPELGPHHLPGVGGCPRDDHSQRLEALPLRLPGILKGVYRGWSLSLLSALVAVGFIAASADAKRAAHSPPLRVPARLAQALVRQGYPVRHPCGSVLEPPPRRGTHGVLVGTRAVAACWLRIYKAGYSVSISPHTSRAAAKLAYQRSYNKWAQNTRRVAIGPFLVSGFRVPEADWNVIRRIVSSVAR